MCFEAAHTHDQRGVLHTDFADGNDLSLGRFLTRWLPDLNLKETEVRVNGKPADVVGVTLEPEMDIKVFLGSR